MPDPFTASSGSNSKALYCDPMSRAWWVQYKLCLVLGSYGTLYYAALATLLTAPHYLAGAVLSPTTEL